MNIVDLDAIQARADAATVDQDKLLSTADAAIWAREFKKVEPGVDEGFMIGWFANAMATAERHSALVRSQQAKIELVRELADKWEADFPSKANDIRAALSAELGGTV